MGIINTARNDLSAVLTAFKGTSSPTRAQKRDALPSPCWPPVDPAA